MWMGCEREGSALWWAGWMDKAHLCVDGHFAALSVRGFCGMAQQNFEAFFLAEWVWGFPAAEE